LRIYGDAQQEERRFSHVATHLAIVMRVGLAGSRSRGEYGRRRKYVEGDGDAQDKRPERAEDKRPERAEGERPTRHEKGRPGQHASADRIILFLTALTAVAALIARVLDLFVR
jgi:hypothetical protein